MVILSKEYSPVCIDIMKFISNGKILEPKCHHWQQKQNQVANELGIKYENTIGLYDIFNYCEINNIDNKSVNSLFNLLKCDIQNIKM